MPVLYGMPRACSLPVFPSHRLQCVEIAKGGRNAAHLHIAVVVQLELPVEEAAVWLVADACAYEMEIDTRRLL